MIHHWVIYRGNTDTMLQNESSPVSATVIQMDLCEIKWDYLCANPIKIKMEKCVP